MKKLWFVIIPMIVVLAAFFYFRDRKANGSQETTVETVTVHRGNIQVKVLSTGTIEPYTRVEVSSPVNGRIDRVLVDEGDMVKEGDVLAWISSEDRIALLDAARSALESAHEANDAEADREAKAGYEIADKAYRPVPLTNSIRGEVISRTCEPGQNVSTQTALFAIADRLVATVQVDEADIGKIKPGQDAWIVLDAYPDERIKARVSKISREGTLVSDVVEYDVMVEPFRVPRHWASGMTANVEFSVASKENVLVIPRSALVEEHGREFVTVGTSAPVRRQIKTGITDGKMIEVVDGLREGDSVIIQQSGTSTKDESSGDSSRRMRMMMGPGAH
jgi:macrolide-specific efflux system membrane fusion protein